MKKKQPELPNELNWRKYIYNFEYGKILYYKENEGTKDEMWRGCSLMNVKDKLIPDNVLIQSAEGRFEGVLSMPASKLYRFKFGLPLTLDFFYDIPSRQAHKKFNDLYFKLGKDFNEAIKAKAPEVGITFSSFTSFLQYCNDFTKKEIREGSLDSSTHIMYEGNEYDINRRTIIGNNDYIFSFQERFEPDSYDASIVVVMGSADWDKGIVRKFPYPSNTGKERHKVNQMPYKGAKERTELFITILRWIYETYLEK